MGENHYGYEELCKAFMSYRKTRDIINDEEQFLLMGAVSTLN